MMAAAAHLKPPSPFLMMLEGRILGELAACCLAMPMLRSLPKGDGHPVLVLPGFGTGDLWTVPLRRFLSRLGYAASPWLLGTNIGPSRELAEQMAVRVRELRYRHRRRVSLVGWSLGGIYARELARAMPEHVRQVITLGSPFNGNPKANHSWWLIEWMSGLDLDSIEPEQIEKIRTPPPVPSTAIYTRSDGMTAWQCCLERPSPRAENVEVEGSHSGLPYNPSALLVIADRLAQRPGSWQPFQPPGKSRRPDRASRFRMAA